MKHIKSKKLFLIICLSFFTTVNAQSINEFQIGLSIPQGDFADDRESNFLFEGSGIASTGLYLAYKHLSALSDSGLFWTANAGVMYNGLQKDFKEDFEEEYDEFDVDVNFPRYLNIPLMLGLQYESSVSETNALFGEFALGLNFLKVTDWELEDDFGDTAITFDWSNTLCYKLGFGILLNEKYTVSVNYLGLGSHKVNYEIEYPSDFGIDDEEDKFDDPLPISSFNLVFGVRF